MSFGKVCVDSELEAGARRNPREVVEVGQHGTVSVRLLTTNIARRGFQSREQVLSAS